MTRDHSHQAQPRDNVYAPMRSSLGVVSDRHPDLTPLAVTLIITLAVLATAYNIVGGNLSIVTAILATMDGLMMGLVAALLPGSLIMGGWRARYWRILRALAYLVAVAMMLPFTPLLVIHPMVPVLIATLLLLVYLLERDYRRRQIIAPESAPDQ